MNGIIIIDKPASWTSHDVVAKLRGALKQKNSAMTKHHTAMPRHRVGHGGTLDPMATGVLPVFIGRATRAAEFCENAEKEYLAEIQLGITTDTQDITGRVLSKNDVNVAIEDLKAVLPRFTGTQKQIPPMYSAIKKDGQKLYDLARKGIDIPREPREIFISKLEIIQEPMSSKHTYTLQVICSKGTYIRTLCHDIGTAIGCGGTLSALKRTRAGVYSINNAHTLNKVFAALLTDSVSTVLLPVDSIFAEYPAISLATSELSAVKNGAPCKTKEDTENGKYRVYAPDGEFLLLGEVKNNRVKTIKSFFEVK